MIRAAREVAEKGTFTFGEEGISSREILSLIERGRDRVGE
jgi:hypothetical protein